MQEWFECIVRRGVIHEMVFSGEQNEETYMRKIYERKKKKCERRRIQGDENL